MLEPAARVVAVMVASAAAMAASSASCVRALALRRLGLSLAKACSMGLKSGL